MVCMNDHASSPIPTVADLPDAVREAVEAMEDKKALDVVVLDLRGTDAFTDFFVVGSGQSTRQVTAIADAIHARLGALGTRPAHVEGYDHAEWVLMDCFDFLVHIFTRETRRLYDLERLWGSSVRIEIHPPDSTDPRSLTAGR